MVSAFPGLSNLSVFQRVLESCVWYDTLHDGLALGMMIISRLMNLHLEGVFMGFCLMFVVWYDTTVYGHDDRLYIMRCINSIQ